MNTGPVVTFGDDAQHEHPLARTVHAPVGGAFPAPTGEGIPPRSARRASPSQVPPPGTEETRDGSAFDDARDQDDEAPEPAGGSDRPAATKRAPQAKKSETSEPKTINRLARLLAAQATQDDKDRVHRFKDQLGIHDEGDYVWVIWAAGDHITEITRNSAKELRGIFEDGASVVSESLGKIDLPQVGERIAEHAAPIVAGKIDRASQLYTQTVTDASRRKWGFLYGLLIGGAFALGCLFSYSLDFNHYRERWEGRIAGFPHLQALIGRPAGDDAVRLLEMNGDDALHGLTSCSSAYGLKIVQSRSGDRVCVGSDKAAFGFRIP